ncbi:MAG: LysM peptidoglycan-binding domain-containing protein, partial [Brevinematia bacterium]
SNLREEIKSLYSQAETNYNEGNYEDSLETLDKVNELLNLYSIKSSELAYVNNEINKRKEVKVTKKYKIQPGDFLSKIATKLFKGQYWWWPKIFTANKDKISDPDLIDKDIEITIPEIPQE